MKTTLGILLAVSVIVNVLLLLVLVNRQERLQTQNGAVPEAVLTQIREIAVICGAPEAQAKNQGAAEMLADVKNFLGKAESGDALAIPDDKWKLIEMFLIEKNKPLLSIIREQDQVVSRLSGRKYVILPQKTPTEADL